MIYKTHGMDIKRGIEQHSNPFKPHFGSAPRDFVRREDFEKNIGEALDNPNSAWNSIILTGVRGSGKTSLLAGLKAALKKFDDIKTISLTTLDGTDNLTSSLVSELEMLNPDCDLAFNNIEVSLAGLVKFSLGNRTREMTLQRLTMRLLDNLKINTQLNESNKLIILIDEAQASFQQIRLIGSIYQIWKMNGYNVMIIVAGLPSLIDQISRDSAVSFWARSINYQLNPLDTALVSDMYYYVLNTEGSERSITRRQTDKLAEISQGYPYMTQILGSQIWAQGPGVISDNQIVTASHDSHKWLNNQLFGSIQRDLSKSDWEVLSAIAKVGNTFNIEQLQNEFPNKSTDWINNYLDRLETNGLIQITKPEHYQIIFPFLREFVLNNGDSI